MTMPSLQDALTEIARALGASLGENLLALYAFDDLASGADSGAALWLFIRPGTQMQQVHQAFYPLWTQYAQVLGRGPSILTPADLERCSLLFPFDTGCLHAEARLIIGADVRQQLPELPQPDPAARLARIAGEAIRCSALLAPSTLKGEQRRELKNRLGRAAALLIDSKPEGATPPIEMLTSLHAHLASQSHQLATYHWDGPPPAEVPPPHLPGLIALVGWEHQLIVVLPRVDRSLLSDLDWEKVAELVSDEFTNVLVATPWQLRLAASVEFAIDHNLQLFETIWGSDLLADCRPDKRHIALSAAEIPFQTLVERFPARYLTEGEETLGKLIHDIQNILLNVQLRNEIVARKQGIPAQQPPEPLPGRETPPHQRIAANFNHLRWWVEHLTADISP